MSDLPPKTPVRELPQELLRLQLELSPYPTLIADAADGVVLYVSNRVKDGIGDVVGKTYFELGFWGDEENRQQTLAAARRPNGFTRRIDAADGNTHVLTSRVIDFDGVEYLISSTVEISSVIRVELELERTLARLENAQALALVGDFIANVEGQTLDGSAEFMRLFGFGNKAGAVKLQDVIDQFHRDDRDRVLESFNALRPGEEFTMEHRLVAEDECWVETHLELEIDDNGQPIARGTTQDITQRKRDERERERLLLKMQETQRLESLGLLSGGVAHDFNNLLAGILGNADFALLESDIPPEIERRLRDIVTASRRAADLTRQLLAYSGKGRFVIEPASLTTMVREMADLLRITIDKNDSLNFHLADGLPAVEVDLTQLRQVIMNLILNASEAIHHEQGIIGITTDVQYCDANYIAISELSSEITPGTYVYVEISDNGVGMDKETQERLYDPFFTTKFTGRGLGMAAVQGIVHGHDGAIKIYSEVDKGSTFKILLPASEQSATQPSAHVQAGEIARGQGTVLIIDDERTVRDFIKTVLERFGYTVFSANGGDEGMRLFREHEQDVELVLLDLTMPKKDGLQVFSELRQLNPDVRTVLMSGYNEQDATQRFVGKGLAGFLAKPFLVNDLMAIVEAGRDDRRRN